MYVKFDIFRESYVYFCHFKKLIVPEILRDRHHVYNNMGRQNTQY